MLREKWGFRDLLWAGRQLQQVQVKLSAISSVLYDTYQFSRRHNKWSNDLKSWIGWKLSKPAVWSCSLWREWQGLQGGQTGVTLSSGSSRWNLQDCVQCWYQSWRQTGQNLDCTEKGGGEVCCCKEGRSCSQVECSQPVLGWQWWDRMNSCEPVADSRLGIRLNTWWPLGLPHRGMSITRRMLTFTVR